MTRPCQPHASEEKGEKRKERKEDIYRFNTSLKLGIKNKGKKFEIDIDYHLYELINNINNGYCINGSDKNFYTDFNRFVTEIMSYGNKNIETLIISKEKNLPRREGEELYRSRMGRCEAKGVNRRRS